MATAWSLVAQVEHFLNSRVSACRPAAAWGDPCQDSSSRQEFCSPPRFLRSERCRGFCKRLQKPETLNQLTQDLLSVSVPLEGDFSMFDLMNRILRPGGQYARLDAPSVRDQLQQCDMLEVVEEYRQIASSDAQAIDSLLACLRQQHEELVA